MSLHPFLAAKVAATAEAPPMSAVPLAKLRKASARLLETGLPPEPVAAVRDVMIGGPRGPLRLRVYTPEGPGPHPLTVFFHGSGFVICSIETHDGMCRQICRQAGTVVVSVDYALAPEQPYPAAPDDCLAAVQWAVAHAAEIGANAGRLALCGDSAGGAMATVTARRLRDAGGSPVRAQALIYPVTDHYSRSHASFTSRGTGFGLSSVDMTWFWDQYVTGGALADTPDVSPLRTADLSGMPQAIVITAEYDLLRDEGLAYAAALARSNISVTWVHCPDMNHGFLNWVGLLEGADRAMETLTGWLRRALA